MLTTNDTDFRDGLSTVTSVVTLLDELLAARAPGRDFDLSNHAANGLGDIIYLVKNTMEEANVRLGEAARMVKGQEAAQAEAEYRRGRAEGFALGAAGVSPILGRDEPAVRERWVRVGCTIAKMSLCGELDDSQKRRMTEDVRLFLAAWTEEEPPHPDEAPVPRLTETDDALDGDGTPKQAEPPTHMAG